MDIKNAAEKYNDWIISRRRWYHAHPELTQYEKETTAELLKDIREIGITDIKPFGNGWYGFIAFIHGGKPGKTVMLRADIDALPVREETGLPFASENGGKMHACGHDAHMAMLLGAAKILWDIREELTGTVALLFQPAEEWGLGAPEVMRQGGLQGVDALYGVHVWSSLPALAFNFESGDRMAGAGKGSIVIKGAGAHGSAPHLGHDAIVAASAVVMGIQAIVSRMRDPLKPLVVGVGTIQGGEGYNIIPSRVEMSLTIRFYDEALGRAVGEMIRDVAERTAKAYGCEAEVSYYFGVKPLKNSAENLVRIARDAVSKLYGDECLLPMEKLTSSEDFANYGEKVPYVFGFVGVQSPDIPGSEQNNHNKCFTVDERILSRGAAVAAQFAQDYLMESGVEK
ncbi:MAG: amidohydrolase [Fusobacteriaceae bacterium]|nr:amidohydrolase [Fusobacteriaceae bacterium]